MYLSLDLNSDSVEKKVVFLREFAHDILVPWQVLLYS